MKNIGIKEVADYANVSVATVSNVINGTRPVSEKLRRLVMQAISELGYESNLAVNPKQKSTKTIGVIVTSLRRVFFPEVLHGIQKNSEKYGYNILIDTSEDKFEREAQIVKMLSNNKVDGIILHTLSDKNDQEYLSYLSNLKRYNKRIPVVSMERNLLSSNIDSVYVDNYSGGRLAIQHLLDLGSKEIACISGPVNSEVSNDRYRAYCDMMNENGTSIKESMVYVGDYSPLSGYRLTRRLLLNGIKPDAIFSCNDQMAIGAIYAIKEFGLNIPENIKVVGFDNTFVSSIISPQLTTINVPKYRMGEEAFSLLYKRMSESEENANMNNDVDVYEKDAEGIELPIDIIIRQSTDSKIKSPAWDLEVW